MNVITDIRPMLIVVGSMAITIGIDLFILTRLKNEKLVSFSLATMLLHMLKKRHILTLRSSSNGGCNWIMLCIINLKWLSFSFGFILVRNVQDFSRTSILESTSSFGRISMIFP